MYFVMSVGKYRKNPRTTLNGCNSKTYTTPLSKVALLIPLAGEVFSHGLTVENVGNNSVGANLRRRKVRVKLLLAGKLFSCWQTNVR